MVLSKSVDKLLCKLLKTAKTEDAIAFLQTFLDYPKSFGLQNVNELSCNYTDMSGLETEVKKLKSSCENTQ